MPPTIYEIISPDERRALMALKTSKTIEEKTGLERKPKPDQRKKAA